jgi:lipoprotein NlpI
MLSLRHVLLPLLSGFLLWAAEPAVEELRERAISAWRGSEKEEAVELISRAIAASPKDSRLFHVRAQMRMLLRNGKGALNDLDEAVRLDPEIATLRQERAGLLFKAGKIDAACADFDKANELAPALVPQNWQRGIALYYAGRFADGRKQFETHKSANPEDVENAAWHYLCVAKTDGVEAARKLLIEVSRDSRVPMAEIQRLFAGKGTEEQVFAAAKAGEPAPSELREREFYAHLYVGLFREAAGDATKAKEHMIKAASLAIPGNYMGDVARVHTVLLQLPKLESSPKQP